VLISVIKCFDFQGTMTLQKQREVAKVAEVEEPLLGVVEEAEVEEAEVGHGQIGAEAGDMTKAMVVMTPTLEIRKIATMLATLATQSLSMMVLTTQMPAVALALVMLATQMPALAMPLVMVPM
jgi:hypothetical protein